MTTIQVFGHRGAPAHRAENSLASFSYALTHGADGIETDVQRTLDGELVVMHDERIDRTTDGVGAIADMTYTELSSYHLANGEPIPKFADVLRIIAPTTAQFNLELKTNKVRYAGIEAEVLTMMTQFGMRERTLYSSFNPDSLVTIHKLDAHLKLALITGRKEPPRWEELRPLVVALHSKYNLTNLDIDQRIWTINDLDYLRVLTQRPRVVGIFTDDCGAAKQALTAIENEVK